MDSTPPPDESRTYVAVATAISTTVIALILTILRLYVRLRMIKLFGYDDVFNILAMLTMIVVMALVLVAADNGFGRHIQYVNPENAVVAIEMLRISEFFLIICTVFVKFSICLFLLRIFTASKAWKIFLWAFIAFNTITSCLDAAFIFPQCTPVEYNWNKSIDGYCWSNEAIDGVGLMQGCIAAATDFILSGLPIIFLWDIKIKLRVKIGICAVMAVGFASGAFAIVRTTLVPGLVTTQDPTWDLIPLFMWALLESNFNVIAAALPSVRPLLGANSRRTADSKASANKPPSKSTISWRQPPRGVARIYDEETQSGDDEISLYPYDRGAIKKTTDVDVSYTKDPISQHQGSEEEILRPDATFYGHNSVHANSVAIESMSRDSAR